MALVVPSMPCWRASGSPEGVNVRSRRAANPRAMKSCSPKDNDWSSSGAGRQRLLLANADGGKVGDALRKDRAHGTHARHCNEAVGSNVAIFHVS